MPNEELDQDFLFDDLVSDGNPGGNVDPDADPDEGDPQGGNPNPDNDDDDPPAGGDPNVDPNADHNADPDKDKDPPADPNADPNKDKDPNTDPNADPGGDPNLSGIEQYLSQFDIEGGIIKFDDGTESHFNDLDPEKQSEILTQLHDQTASTVESKYGLDQQEIGLINLLRENDLSVEQMIEEMAQERVQTILAMQTLGSDNYDEMTADAVYTKFLQKSNPEATVEQIEEDLAKAKEQKNYDKVVESVRAQFKTEQQSELARAQQTEQANQQATIDSQRQIVLDAAVAMTDIDGVKLNDGIKNGILDHVLEVNDHGDSLFMEDVFSDPNNLMKAAFWFYNGAELMRQRDEYWKKEKSAAYKRGRESALGKDEGKISFRAGGKGGAAPDKSTPSQSNDNDYVDLDTLHLNT